MKKIAAIFLLTVLLILPSCVRESDPSFPDGDADYVITVTEPDTSGERGEPRKIVLSVRRRDGVSDADVLFPEELRTVSLSVSDAGIAVRSGFCDIPMSENAGSGIRAIFSAVDSLSGRNGVLPHAVFSDSSVSFDLSYGGIKRRCEITDIVSVQK